MDLFFRVKNAVYRGTTPRHHRVIGAKLDQPLLESFDSWAAAEHNGLEIVDSARQARVPHRGFETLYIKWRPTCCQLASGEPAIGVWGRNMNRGSNEHPGGWGSVGEGIKLGSATHSHSTATQQEEGDIAAEFAGYC